MRGVLLLALMSGSLAAVADEPAPADPNHPYRTDTANADLPWYQLKAGEFPPHGSEHRVGGTLVEADFIQRTGQFRATDTGELVDFTLLPFATVMYRDAEADLRDVPLGTSCQFALYQDARSAFTQVAALRGEAESGQRATEQQRERNAVFLKARGLPARIDRVEGRKLTVTLFGDPASLQALCKREGIVPSQWAQEHRAVDAVVANEELRTYNPPVDRRRATVLEFQPVPTDAHGCSGVRWVIEPDLLLEGFRKGRIIRLFVHPSWPINDMPFGEGLYSEAPGVKAGVEEPTHYPYRTDFANEDLPWYRLKPGEFPPLLSHHLVVGELVQVDADRRSGRFRADRTGELVDFTMPPFGTVQYVNAEADLRDLPLGTRYRFLLYQDERGAFTKAAVITDEFTNLAGDDLTYRLDAVELDKGKILLAKRHAPVKNEKEDLIQPPDLDRGEFTVAATTRVWKGDQRIELSGLVVGDELLVNRSGRTATNRGVCTDIWVGRETHKHATERQRARHDASLKERGLPAWIDRVKGKTLTITFFSGSRKHFLALLNQDVKGDGVSVTLADEALRPLGAPPRKLRFRDQHVEGEHGGTYGTSGVRWRIEAERLDDHDRPGQVIRVFREGRPIRDDPSDNR